MKKPKAKRALPSWTKEGYVTPYNKGGGLKHKYVTPEKPSVSRPYPWDAMDVVKPKIK